MRGGIAAERPDPSVKVSNLPIAVVDVLDEHVLKIMTGAARVVPASWQTVPVWDITRYGFWEKTSRLPLSTVCGAAGRRRSWRKQAPGQGRRLERSWCSSGNSAVLSRRNSG